MGRFGGIKMVLFICVLFWWGGGVGRSWLGGIVGYFSVVVLGFLDFLRGSLGFLERVL